MEKYHSAEAKDTFSWDFCDYEEYIAGYKLYKQLKGKWDAIANEETSDAIQQILG